jgi:hypothetical protein
MERWSSTRLGACLITEPQPGDNVHHDLILICNVEVKWDISNTREGTRRGSGCILPGCIPRVVQRPHNRVQTTIDLPWAHKYHLSLELRAKYSSFDFFVHYHITDLPTGPLGLSINNSMPLPRRSRAVVKELTENLINAYIRINEVDPIVSKKHTKTSKKTVRALPGRDNGSQ